MKDVSYMGLEKINIMRNHVGLSIDELSEKSGVPKGTLSKITAGITKNPSVDTVKSIVHAMGFTLYDLDNFPELKIKSVFAISDQVDSTFGKRLRSARVSLKLTQKELASKIGVKHNSISDWENDKNKPDPDTIELLCGVLEISPNYLLGLHFESSVSPSELEIIKKYRSLDDYGKDIIDTILEKEYARCEDEYVEIAARGGKYKVKREALIELAKRLDAEPYEEDHDLC
ncbi:helix-turn-helix transcriptional regulator [Anaerotignum sp.]|uniref:helix-turn-helix transcriptional regulator n=1 Tax=Anaerotignum sp. TaxID=2039241 RepID=UPI003735B517